MKIKFTPSRMNYQAQGFVDGDIISINGEVLDFSALGEGDILPCEAVGNDMVASEITRINGVIHLSVISPHGVHVPHESKYPSGDFVDVEGVIPFPAYSEILSGEQE